MAQSFRRSQTLHDEVLVQYDGLRLNSFGRTEDGKHTVMIERTPNPSLLLETPGAVRDLHPPYHVHFQQDEFFETKSGRYTFLLEGVETTHSADSGLITIPHGHRHTFWTDTSLSTPAEIHITMSPIGTNGINEIDERGFRNTFSYLDDCRKQNVAPNPAQMVLMLGSFDTGIALPGPRVVALWASWAVRAVVGWGYGEWWLGFRESYGEYWEEGKGV